MPVELLYFDGCPNHERLLPRLRELVRAHGQTLELRRIETAEQAECERFLGSPTVRVDGEDVEPGAGERRDYGMKCRIFWSGAGHAPLPPEEWIVSALERARGG